MALSILSGLSNLDLLEFNAESLQAVNSKTLDKIAIIERSSKSNYIVLIVSDNKMVGKISYYARAKGVKCSVKLWPNNVNNVAMALKSANGFGYCRESVALSKALESMGIYWNISFIGRGLSDSIYLKLAQSIGYNSVSILNVKV